VRNATLLADLPRGRGIGFLAKCDSAAKVPRLPLDLIRVQSGIELNECIVSFVICAEAIRSYA